MVLSRRESFGTKRPETTRDLLIPSKSDRRDSRVFPASTTPRTTTSTEHSRTETTLALATTRSTLDPLVGSRTKLIPKEPKSYPRQAATHLLI